MDKLQVFETLKMEIPVLKRHRQKAVEIWADIDNWSLIQGIRANAIRRTEQALAETEFNERLRCLKEAFQDGAPNTTKAAILGMTIDDYEYFTMNWIPSIAGEDDLVDLILKGWEE